MSIPSLEVSVVANRNRIPGFKNYTISQDMLQPADYFDLEVAYSRDAWNLLTVDPEITVSIGNSNILTGYIDRISKSSSPEGGTNIRISGRDKTGRLVDESAPLFSYGGLRIKDLAEKVVGLKDGSALFDRVTLVNTRNRALLRTAKARKAKVVREPLIDKTVDLFRPFARAVGLEILPITVGPSITRSIPRPALVDPGIFRGRAVPKKVPPGTPRWAVLEQFLREARLIAWASGDGRELFVGLPNYEQENQWFFYESGSVERNNDQTNCALEISFDTSEIYSRITAVGSSTSTSSSYGSNVTKNRATVYDNPENETDGTGIRLRQAKSLIVTDDSITSARDALERAEREQLEREATWLEVSVLAPGHSQLFSGETPAVFTVDTMARVEDEDTGVKGDFLVTRCDYTHSPFEGTQTRLTLVPKGTLLQL